MKSTFNYFHNSHFMLYLECKMRGFKSNETYVGANNSYSTSQFVAAKKPTPTWIMSHQTPCLHHFFFHFTIFAVWSCTLWRLMSTCAAYACECTCLYYACVYVRFTSMGVIMFCRLIFNTRMRLFKAIIKQLFWRWLSFIN